MNYQEIFAPEEWTHLKNVMSSIHHHIPEHQMGLVWNSYQRIARVNTVQPCGCPGTAKYWVEAVNTINNFIKEQGV
jgi:hypothetical protein